MPASTSALEFSLKRNVKAAAVLTLCLLCSYDRDLVFMINKHKIFGKHRKIKHLESRKKLLTFYTLWAVSDSKLK